MQPSWDIRTGRLSLAPVAWDDLADLVALKADPRAFAMLLGGVRNATQTARELAEDAAFWASHGFGIWAIRELKTGTFVGITGLMLRDDGRGVALRFALRPEERGHGYASEAAAAALRFGHNRAALPRIVAVARADNTPSRQVLGAIGMRLVETFTQQGYEKVLFESVR